MRKAFSYRMYPTKKQVHRLESTLEAYRWLYTHLLEMRKTAWEHDGKSLSCSAQQATYPILKAQRPSLNAVHSHVLQNVAVRVDLAFKAFFRRVKAGEKPGYPRFKGHGRYDSITYPQSGFSLTHDDRVALSKIGSVKMVYHRPIKGTIKTCTITVRRVSSSKRARQNVAGSIGISHVHLAYPCLMAEISKEKGECSMLGRRQRRRELPPL